MIILKTLIKKQAIFYLYKKLLIIYSYIHSQFVLDNENFRNNFLKNMVTNAAIEQSNMSRISKYSISPKKEHPLFNNKQISLREKLILWINKHKVEQKCLTVLLNIVRSEGYNNLSQDGRTLMNIPRSYTILFIKYQVNIIITTVCKMDNW